jgi:hypothetical protein
MWYQYITGNPEPEQFHQLPLDTGTNLAPITSYVGQFQKRLFERVNKCYGWISRLMDVQIILAI